ncbi:DNA-binding domain-containing protein [Microbulbifer halophilus]|uniref:DUF2063 domain-containing protein n=1 Tax=Microbulbifer halophilus TaxID=453963 RepID=A0ABW5EBT6_9GAMM|nr:DNA-binding domain-containing protein [Microbulbifer halophilus]MCW8125964.1 DNA-binding domain-containing protein [Microbulbifer halophilus]
MKAETGWAEWTTALLDPDQPTPAGLRAWNGSDPAHRFAVYRNNVTVSLIEALASAFPVTQQLAGEALFRGMAREFVRAAPPRSPLLAEYGADFPAFLADFPPAEAQPWLADTARLELACTRAYHATDAEPVAPEKIQALLEDTDALPASRFSLHPSLHTLQSPWAVASLWATYQNAGDLDGVDVARAENTWILRSGLQVAVLRMRAGDCHFADALQRRATFAEAAERALQSDPEFDLSACLAVLLREQMITAVEQ